jgi:hypothetical protein
MKVEYFHCTVDAMSKNGTKRGDFYTDRGIEIVTITDELW